MSERELTAAFSAKLLEQVQYLHVLCQIEFPSGTVRFWTGQENANWDGVTFDGVGRAIAFGRISETTDGSVQGVTLDISGIDSADLDDVQDDEFQDSDVTIWIAHVEITASSHFVYDPFQYFKGKLDSAEVIDDGTTSTITFKAESKLINQVKRNSWRWTDQDQRQLFPGDLGLEFVAGIQDKKIIWKNEK